MQRLSLRVAVIGFGWIGSRHAALLSTMAGIDLVAVCDTDRERGARAAQRAAARAYSRWEELLERESLDAVFLCTPPRAHRAPAVAALADGTSVFLEKPIARTMEDAAAITAAADRSDAICAVGYQWHGLDLLDDLRGALHGQTIGLLVGHIFAPTEPRAWFVDRAQSGGDMLERATHLIDLERLLGGEVAAVAAATSQARLAHADDPQADIDDVISLMLRFHDGHLGAVHVGWTRQGLPPTHRMDVVATEAILHLELGADPLLRGVARGMEVEARARQDPFASTVEHFIGAVAARSPTEVFCTPEDARRTLAVALACESAAESGSWVTVPDRTAPGRRERASEDAVAREGL